MTNMKWTCTSVALCNQTNFSHFTMFLLSVTTSYNTILDSHPPCNSFRWGKCICVTFVQKEHYWHFRTLCSFHKISKKQAAWSNGYDMMQGSIYCSSRVGWGCNWGTTVRSGSWERGRDGPEAPSKMLARHGSSLPGLGFRRVKSEKTNLPVDLSGEV